MGHDLAFCELRCKDVINVIDGKCLGRVCDVIFSRCNGRVMGFIVPGEARFRILRRREDMFIPFNCICKIGCDVILVELKGHCHGGNPAGKVVEEIVDGLLP